MKRTRDFSSIIFLCIGTDRITGDTYGPLVGHNLKSLYKTFGGYSNVKVIGDLETQISNFNITKQIEKIYIDFEKPCIIAIDSAVSKKKQVGSIVVEDKGMYVGKAMNKKDYLVGDVSIKGVVSKDFKFPKYNFNLLQNIPLGMIMKMADMTSKGIYEVMKYN